MNTPNPIRPAMVSANSMRTPSRRSAYRTRTPSLTETPTRGTARKVIAPGSDRFIPNRSQMNIELCSASLFSTKKRNRGDLFDEAGSEGVELQAEFQRQMKAALFDIPLDDLPHDKDDGRRRMLSFRNERQTHATSSNLPHDLDNLRVLQGLAGTRSQGGLSIDDFATSNRGSRRLVSSPIRVLDAPDVSNDFYINILSWSEDNILAVGLGPAVYLYCPEDNRVHHLMTLKEAYDYVTSISWDSGSNYVSIGGTSGRIQIFNIEKLVKVRTLKGHESRVGTIAWSNKFLSSGGRDALIFQHDVRSRNHIVSSYCGHKQEVCGLKWNEDETMLASGGNDNRICIWDVAMSSPRSNRSCAPDHTPRLLLKEHSAAVKALDWCPFRRGMLASGGGTHDNSIKFWNTYNGTVIDSIDTGSQVCGLLWSKHRRELCSAHGYSDPKLTLWNFPTMKKLQDFKRGNDDRILHLAQSPDGSSVASLSSDETLCFWDVFGAPPPKKVGFSQGCLPTGTNTIR